MKNLIRILAIFLGTVLSLFTAGCATYHSIGAQYEQALLQGDYKNAMATLEKNKFLKKNRNQLLYYLEKGKLAYLNKEYVLSNQLFNKADVLIENNQSNKLNKVLGAFTNPEKETYQSEDFEKVAIHYYKALNYTFLHLYDDALVEAKRINLQLQKINDAYPKGKKNRYTTDAFALNLQGLLYEASGNLNDAFIAYRNAVEVYKKNGETYFGVSIPTQLKQDLINVAHLLGFVQEEQLYSKMFNMQYKPQSTHQNTLVLFWETGLVPYKSQTYFTFTALPGVHNGFVDVTNEALGIRFPVPVNSNQTNGKFSDTSVFNVSFPKYVDRTPLFSTGKVWVDDSKNKTYNLELAQDYKTIAFETLKDRTLREIGKTALRIATKKLSENIVKNQNANLGALLGLFNAFTEKSDTRNWQTLPNKIYYTRVPLSAGKRHKVTMAVKSSDDNTIYKEFDVKSLDKLNFINYITPQIITPN